MSEPLQGLEVFLSTDKAVAQSRLFQEAVERAAQAVEFGGKAIDQLDKSLERVGKNKAGSGMDSAAKQLRAIADETARAAKVAARERAEAERQAARDRTRRDDAFRDLRNEEKALRLVGVERQRFRHTLDAEQTARRAGLALGSREHSEFVKRSVAYRELAAAQELAAARGNSLGRTLKTIAQLSAGFGGLLAIRSGIAAITDSEDRLRILGSVTGATAAEMEKLSAAANALSLGSRFSFGDATQTLINLAKAGATANEAIVALPSVSNLARAGLLTLDSAADTVIQTMAQFGLTITDASRIGDVLVKAANSTTSSVDTLADSLRKVGPVGREFGLSMETVTASIAQLQQSGVQARVAGTGLAQIFKQLADPVNGPEGAADAINRLNLSFDDIHPRNFTRALDNLAKSGLTLQDATAIVGTEFDYLLTTLVRGREGVKGLETSLKSAGGDAAKQAAATVGTLGDSIASLSNAAERFYREGGKAGLSRALQEITVAGADALNVLSGDAEAMGKAGTAGHLLAGGLKVAGSAMAGMVTFSALRRIGSFESAMFGAGRSVGALTTVIRANPIGALVSVAAAAGVAFSLFGSSVSEASARLEKFRGDASEAETVARRFDEIRQRLQSGGDPGARTRGVDDLTASLREQVILIEKAQKLGERRIPAEGILGALEQAAPETVAQMRNVMAEMLRLEKAGEKIPDALNDKFGKLNSDILVKFGFTIEDVRGKFESFGAGGRAALEGFDVVAKSAGAAVGKELDRLVGKAGTAKEALEGAARAVADLQGGPRKGGDQAPPDRARVDAIAELLRLKDQELALSAKSEDGQRRAKLLQEAQNAAIASGRKLRYEELLALEMIARQQDKNARKDVDEKRAKAVNSLLTDLRDENALLGQQGAAREALKKQQEVIAALKEAHVASTAAEYVEALKLLDVHEQLLLAEEARNEAAKGQKKRDTRTDEAFRTLEQEEAALRLTGAERTRYMRQIEAENELRQTGVEIGSAEYADYIKRRIAATELADAQETLARLGGEFGSSWGNALERFLLDAEKGRDVARALGDDLARLAFRQTVTNNLQKGFEMAGQALATWWNAPTAASPHSGPGGNTGWTTREARLSGGLIPALGGQVIDEPSFLQRAGRMYSVAEGGRSTPEAVLPLQRDDRGRLGVAAAGGGGGGTTNMIFPSVRNNRDARAVRATMGQRASELMAIANKKGRRGLRP